jgi:hypothetical protein
MRIESVTAHAFGPLVGQSLSLAPGLTVIAGANESAKSSWHGALYSALCGRRRGKGAQTKPERRFAELHRPWDGGDWRVSAVISLADGRRVELTHDLNGKVDCRALDLGVSRDVSAEVIWDGSPDGSRWLGLDRKSFATTACVSQAELLTVLAAADGLQEHLQRAAATAGTDATAAAALERLDRFTKEHVGVDRANSVKPLRTARTRLAQAETVLSAALRDREQHAQLLRAAEDHRRAADAASARVPDCESVAQALTELLAAAQECAAAQQALASARDKLSSHNDVLTKEARRLARAAELDVRFGGRPPASRTEQEDLARIVETAVVTWRAVPVGPALAGPKSAQLRAELAQLPEPPIGDLVVAPEVRALLMAHENASAVASAHQERRPSTGEVPDGLRLVAANVAGPAGLRELAAALEANGSHAVATAGADAVVGLERAAADARERQRHAAGVAAQAQQAATVAAERQRHLIGLVAAQPSNDRDGGRRALLFGVSGFAALLGVVLFVLFGLVPGAAALAVAVAIGVLAAVRSGRPTVPAAPSADVATAAAQAQQAAAHAEQAHRSLLDADRALVEADGRHSAAVASARQGQQARADLAARCATRHLPSDPAALRTLAAQVQQLAECRTAHDRWDAERDTYDKVVATTAARLRSALVEHGEVDTTHTGVDTTAAFGGYEDACARRAAQSAKAARRAEVERALADRTAAEAAADDAGTAHTTAIALLRAAATSACVNTLDVAIATPAELVAALTEWQKGWEKQLKITEEEQGAWAELVTVLAGSSVVRLRATEATLRAERDVLDQRVRAATVAAEEAARRRDELALDPTIRTVVADVAVDDIAGVTAALTRARHDVIEARLAAEPLVAAAGGAEGELREHARRLPSVPEAEESVAAALATVERVDSLSSTLDLTTRFLVRAQERVHRDIAPVLATTLRTWLPRVTDGRYVDATIDPATLQVMVCGPSRQWRHADRLSIGTAEQVYLLLRFALAKHLTVAGEPCPLLLDDVTVQADDVRTVQILDLLLELAQERQIVLFAQETGVRDWARARLTGDRHALHELAPVVAV